MLYQRNYVLLLLLCLLSGGLAAQQDPQYTQFMNYKLGYNAAFAGAEETSVFTLFAREQWLGVDGAPSSQILTYNTPLTSSGTGIGARISRLGIGLENNYQAEVSYAYRIQMPRGMRLGFGLSARVSQYAINFQDATPVQGGGVDQAIPAGQESKTVPNFGFGIYFNTPSFYFGVSAPKLLESNLDFDDASTVISREVRHYYAMTGIKFRFSENFALQPQALAKYVIGAPFDADFNLSAELGRNLGLGLSYRLGGSTVDGSGESAGAQVTFFAGNHLQFGFNYDLGLSEFRSQHSGSVEAMVRYLVGGRAQAVRIVDPRSVQ
ncbi:hypothetical protein CEQ90_17595 [Lewinellaceae bacterium SD302]|nr:hypothetical protein CEQ90_17595 [Lewinellaceae bacterium SD302]